MPFGLRTWVGPGNHVLDGGSQVLRDVATATNFGTKIAITGFVRTIASKQLVMEAVRVVDRQNAHIAGTLHLRDVAIFWLSIYEVHIGATWRIQLNRPCVAVMRPYVKLL